MERRFAFALTYQRDTVVRAARALLCRVAPREAEAAPAVRLGVPALAGSRPVRSGGATGTVGEVLLRRALAATGTGISIVDLRLPDQPLVYVNRAFEQLAGLPAAEALGRNCRFLQCPDTDPAAVARMRRAVADGVECEEVLLNRRADGSTWWNECRLTPVRDPAGVVVQYIGVQTDVTARVEAERALATERDRSRDYAARLAAYAGEPGPAAVRG
jgi:PAS domain S-box-containing protein